MSTKLKNYRTDMMKKYAKMSKASLARKIMKALKKLPKSKLVQLCYELEKRKLPSLERGFQSQVARIPRRIERGRTNGMNYTIKTTSAPRRLTKRCTAKQLANDRRLGRIAKARAKAKRMRKKR